MKKVTYLVFLCVGIAAFGFWYICPIFNRFPHPTGEYCVGYTRLDWHDNHLHQEVYTEIFYPSTRPKNEEMPFPYQPKKMSALAGIKSQDSVLPQWMWRCFLSNIFCYAEPDVAIVHQANAFPVILYLPGIGGEDLHNITCENLASHGYIVCAIIPAGDIAVAVAGNGSSIPLNQQLKKAMQEVDRDAIYEYRNQAHVRWTAFIESTIDRLTELNNDNATQFYHMLDMHKLGMIGHSHGGAVVTDFCQKNKLCKAGINMDGWTKTYNSDIKFDTPFMLALGSIQDMPEIKSFIHNNERPDFTVVTFTELGHEGFTDYSMLKQPIAALFDVRPLFSWYGQVSHNKYMIVDFFDRYLKTDSKAT